MGLSLYFSASVLALFAPSLQWLVAARLLQALGGAAGITLGRAIVRDIAPPDRVTRDLALLNLLTLVGPGLSPIVGAYLADHFGWRAIYVFLVCIGSAMLFCAWKLLPETNLNRRPLAITRIALDYGSLLANPRFAAFMLGGACSSTALYPYLATAPYIVHEQLGLPIRYVGWFAASTIVGAGLGTFLTRKLAGRWPAERFLHWLRPGPWAGHAVSVHPGAGLAECAAAAGPHGGHDIWGWYGKPCSAVTCAGSYNTSIGRYGSGAVRFCADGDGRRRHHAGGFWRGASAGLCGRADMYHWAGAQQLPLCGSVSGEVINIKI